MTTQPTLNIKTAFNYAIHKLSSDGYSVAIVSTKPSTEYGIEVVDIIFTIESAPDIDEPLQILRDLREPQLRHHTFSVWIEDGEIRGEW